MAMVVMVLKVETVGVEIRKEKILREQGRE